MIGFLFALLAVTAMGDVVFEMGTLFAFVAIFNANSKFDPSSKCWAEEFNTAATEFDSARRAVNSFTRSGRRMAGVVCAFG